MTKPVAVLHYHTPMATWWLAGGIASENCLAAYQPKGAIDFAHSKINLANPGTYDVTGDYPPIWYYNYGWRFSGDWLQTSIHGSGDQTYSAVIRYANQGYGNRGGLVTCGYAFKITARSYYDVRTYDTGTGSVSGITGWATSGVIALAGRQAYFNGVAEGVPAPEGVEASPQEHILLGCLYTTSYYVNADIIALAIYNTTITAAQVLAVTNAINTL